MMYLYIVIYLLCIAGKVGTLVYSEVPPFTKFVISIIFAWVFPFELMFCIGKWMLKINNEIPNLTINKKK